MIPRYYIPRSLEILKIFTSCTLWSYLNCFIMIQSKFALPFIRWHLIITLNPWLNTIFFNILFLLIRLFFVLPGDNIAVILHSFSWGNIHFLFYWKNSELAIWKDWINIWWLMESLISALYFMLWILNNFTRLRFLILIFLQLAPCTIIFIDDLWIRMD